MIKEHQKIKYLKLIRDKRLSTIKDEKFVSRFEASSFLGNHLDSDKLTSIDDGTRGNFYDYVFKILINDGFIQENMKPGTNINEKFFLTIKGKTYIENCKGFKWMELLLGDYPLLFQNLIATIAILISISALIVSIIALQMPHS